MFISSLSRGAEAVLVFPSIRSTGIILTLKPTLLSLWQPPACSINKWRRLFFTLRCIRTGSMLGFCYIDGVLGLLWASTFGSWWGILSTIKILPVGDSTADCNWTWTLFLMFLERWLDIEKASFIPSGVSRFNRWIRLEEELLFVILFI